MTEQLPTKEMVSLEERDAAMRLTGQLQAAHQLVESINVRPENKRVRDLVDSAGILLHKAMLAAWESV